MLTRRSKRLTLVAMALVVAVVLPNAVSAATIEVSIIDFDFVPREVRIAPGDTVLWRNNGMAPHTATHCVRNTPQSPCNPPLFDTGQLNTGQTFSSTFPTPGTFPYICLIHPFMTGVVIVAADGTTTSSTSTSTSTTIPGASVPVAGAAFHIDGTSDRTGASGAPVSVFATRAEPGFSYKLVSGRGTGQRPCSTDVMPINNTARFANTEGVIARTGGTLNRPPGQWQICFLAEGQVVTGAATYTVSG
jgi:plastocyanin